MINNNNYSEGMEEKIHVRSKRRSKINFLSQDWPENVEMNAPMAAQFEAEIEKEDFENEVRNMCSTIQLLVAARRDTITKLVASSDYLDSIWVRCRVSKTMGTGVSVVGGGLTIAGGILTTLTAGAAAPLLIAGIATSSVGAATNIGTSLAEKILNSKQIKDMNEAFERDKEITQKFETQLEDIKRYKVSAHLSTLYYSIKTFIGEKHILLPVLQTVLLYENTPEERVSQGTEHSNALLDGSPGGGNCPPATPSLLKQDSKDKVKYDHIDAGMFVEGGKVIGQNSFRVAGQVIIGISAAFLVWDAIDLGWNISDLVRKQGSQAAKVLRQKAEMLESALKDTIGNYDVEMPE